MLTLYILIGWLTLIFLVGILAGRYKPVRSREDWNVAGRSLHWLTNYFTAHATQLSALTMMGFPGLIYTVGVPVTYAHYVAYMLGTCGFFVLFGVKIWRLGKKFRFVTPTDFLTWYYGGGRWFRYFLAVLFFVALIPYIQIQVIGAGWIFNEASGGLIPLWLGALIMYAIIIAYIWVGGLRSVAYTDVVQGALLLFGLWAGSLGTFLILGGGPKALAIAAEKVPQLLYVSGYKGWDWPFTISWSLVLGVGWAFHVHMWLRMYTPRSEKDARIWSGVIFAENMIHGILLTLAMITAATLFPDIRPDLAFLTMCKKVFPLAMYGVFIAAVAAALGSTLNSQAHALGLVVIHDFLEGTNVKLTDRGYIWANRITVLTAMTAGYILAFYYPMVLGSLAPYPAALGFILLPQVICAVTAQRWVTKYGAIAGLIAGLITMVVFSTGPFKNPFHIHFGLWGVIANTIVFVIVSLLTKPKPSEEVIKEVIEAGW